MNSFDTTIKQLDVDRRIRLSLFSVATILIGIGVVMIYSASAIFADQRYGNSMFFLQKHLVFVVIGTLCAVGAMLVDLKKLNQYAVPIFIGTCIVLLFVFFVADPIAGARRWLRLGPFQIQPSEMAKISLILYLGHVISKRKKKLEYFKEDILPIISAVGIMCALVFMGKDFGTTVVMLTVSMVILFVAGMSIKYFIRLIIGIIPLMVLAVVVEPYRVKRIISFLNPWQDIQTSGFQLYQSLLAIGSGGLSGVGLGHSQQKLFYLPAAHTDFIFAIIGEELGFIGAGAVILLYVAFAVVGWFLIVRTRSLFETLVSAGLVSLILLESTINIGVSIGVLPTKGLALPFISYGGSSLVVKMVAIGLLLNISKKSSEH